MNTRTLFPLVKPLLLCVRSIHTRIAGTYLYRPTAVYQVVYTVRRTYLK